jgi:cation diffusion facilitator CzcD-associated flavoprotein CzcO
MDDATYKFLILGAGYGGLLQAVRLIQAGLVEGDNDLRLVESAGGFGGSWYWNRYPGLHCDVESYSYMPLLEETGYMPKKRYASGPELREHAERIGHMWKLNDKTFFRSEVKTARWIATTKTWAIDIEERRRFDNDIELRHIKVYAHYFIITGGIHTRPQAPRIPGLDLYTGSLFHTARWNYDVTGGSPTRPCLTGLQGKRVGIIGTGATAVQVVPEVAKWASALYVFQRTPSAIHALGQTETNQEEWVTRIANYQGWQRRRMINLNRFPSNGPYNSTSDENLVNDSWTKMPAFSALIGSPAWGIIEPTEKCIEGHVKNLYMLDQPRSDAARAYVDKIVHDGPTAEKLKVCIFMRVSKPHPCLGIYARHDTALY